MVYVYIKYNIMIKNIFKYSLVSFTSILSYNSILSYKKAINSKSTLSELINAAKNGNLELVNDLVEYADADREDIFNYSLNLAAYNGHLDIVKYLVLVNTQINGECPSIHNGSYNALINASMNGHLDIVKYLVENGACVSDYNNKAIKLVSKYKHLDVVNYLTTSIKN